MIQALQAQTPVLPVGVQQAPVKPQQSRPTPVTLNPQDKNLVSLSPTGFVPVQIGLFANPGQTYVDQGLAHLHENMTQQNFRDAQAAFRVSIRQLSLGDLDAAEKAVQSAMQHFGDYRTQKFLDEMGFDIKMERFNRDLRSQAVGAQDLGAKSAAEMVQKALAKLQSNPTEANFRDARAAYRVSIRALDVDGLKSARDQIVQATQQTSDYRTQVFLEQIRLDTVVELAWKDPAYTSPQPQMPQPLTGSTGSELAQSAQARLNGSPTEVNFKDSQAAFRVAIRALDLAGLDLAETTVKSLMAQSNDYRSQVFLDSILTDVKMEKYWKSRP